MECPQLPLDCLLEIFEKITDDTKSLYSCLLVNRIWCQTAIPILWKKPLHDSFSFNFIQPQWRSLSRTIYYCIPKENLEYLQKNIENVPFGRFNNIQFNFKLNSTKVQNSNHFNNNDDDDDKKPMFNYVEFIQYISTESVHRLIMCLLSNPFIIESNDDNLHHHNHNHYNKNSSLLLKSSSSSSSFSYTYNETLLEKELWKIFMKNCITLRHIEHPIFPIFFYSDATTRLNCLIHLECSPVELGTLIFEDLGLFCQNLEKLTLNYDNGVVESVGNGLNEGISKFILKQNGLKEIEFYCPNINFNDFGSNNIGRANVGGGGGGAGGGGAGVGVVIGGIDNNINLREFKKEFNKFIGKSLLKHKNCLKSIIFKENIFISSKILNQLTNIKKFEFKSILGNYYMHHPINNNNNNNINNNQNNINNNNNINNIINRVGLHNNFNAAASLRGLNNLENVKWLNLEYLNFDRINVENEFEILIKLIEGTSTNIVNEGNDNEDEIMENETENEHDSENENENDNEQEQEQMQVQVQNEQHQQQQEEEEQQQRQQQQIIHSGLLLKQISIETDSLIPKSEHIKSYYQSLVRYCPNLEVATIWYLDECKNDFESLIKSCQNLKEITLSFADNLLGNNDVDDDGILSFIFNTLLNYVGDNFSVLNFGEGWKINVEVLHEFLQQWKEKKPLFIWYHMDIDITDDHLQVFEKFKNLGVVKGWERYF